jgi:hypothetical protein
MNNNLREQFESWAEDHLGQGYPLTIDEHTYENPVTRWAFVAYRAAHNSQQAIIDRLMLGYCPNEMQSTPALPAGQVTAEQMKTWGDSQRRVDKANWNSDCFGWNECYHCDNGWFPCNQYCIVMD